MRKQSLDKFFEFPKAGVSAIGLSVLLLSGCVTVPESIRGTTETPQMDLRAVQSAPQLYVGQEARFGGKVVNVTNQQNRTRLEIATMRLDFAARPILGEPSIGRIATYINAFVDPVDLKGQLVTVVGPIAGSEEGTIGKAAYKFLVVNANSYKVWRIIQEVVMPPQPMWGYGGSYYRGWGGGFGPDWGDWYNPGPARIQTFVTE